MLRQDKFRYSGKELYYNTIPFNNRAERVVEIPLLFDFLVERKCLGKILELGHVLWHYENGVSDKLGIRERRIIDKFEIAHRVENIDFLDVSPEVEQYDTIISISTVEHIGQGLTQDGDYGETMLRDYDGPLKALAKIYDLLADGGEALVTVPWGKLLDVDWLIQFDSAYFDRLFKVYGVPESAVDVRLLKRIYVDSDYPWKFQVWEEATESEMRNTEFHVPWPFANGIGCIYVTKKQGRDLTKQATPLSPDKFTHSAIVGGLYHQEALYGCRFDLATQFDEDGTFIVPPGSHVFRSTLIDLNPGNYLVELNVESEDICDLELVIGSVGFIRSVTRAEIDVSKPNFVHFEIAGIKSKLVSMLFKNMGNKSIRLKVKRFTLRSTNQSSQEAISVGDHSLLKRLARKILK